ncbi:helix-turn-helix domain-containing protein [Streptomyces anulatus]|uniref:helix-turn-helix domain-containing protein n=1 Tax=Streptomyces anulatus TaxID=1892 RepID=UPI002253BB0B|nr:helix-turn-helix domain-containing protein [Streptomyces anulatus]MCX4489764.1 helix-turn-helix domain-containing protein [Streptomyces anulatus]
MSTATRVIEPLLYTPAEAAEALRLGRSTIYEEIRLGRLRTVQIGRCRRIPTGYVEEYIDLLKSESAT